MATAEPGPDRAEGSGGRAGEQTPAAARGEQRLPAGESTEMQEARKGWAKQSSSLKEMVGKAMGRWGGGVPDYLRVQVTGASRFDKFTERAKRVLVLAAEEARLMNHNYIGTEHFLLGLSAEGSGIAAKVLDSMDVGLDQVRRGVEFVVGRGDKAPEGPLKLTPRAKRVIELAVDEARRLNHKYIGTEHMLLGLVREGEGVAAGVLESMGATPELVRGKVIEIVTATPGGAALPGPKDNVISCRVGSDDLAAIDLLVEAGIRSTRSDAAQWLIHAGVTANRQLFDQVQGTVDEIRRLRDQARETAQRLAGEARDLTPPENASDSTPG
jgi:ATP-dependent Clp protease ATP-binding subunit ClpA